MIEWQTAMIHGYDRLFLGSSYRVHYTIDYSNNNNNSNIMITRPMIMMITAFALVITSEKLTLMFSFTKGLFCF